MTELNLGADWEQSKRLVEHWHNRWAKAQLKVDWYEADENIREVCKRYSELRLENKIKVDNLMRALREINA